MLRADKDLKFDCLSDICIGNMCVNDEHEVFVFNLEIGQKSNIEILFCSNSLAARVSQSTTNE